MKNNRVQIIVGILLLAVGVSLVLYLSSFGVSLLTWSPGDLVRAAECDDQDGRVFTIYHRKEMLAKMSREVTVGDELITSSGRHYRIVKTDGKNAYADYLGVDKKLLGYGQVEVPAASMAWEGEKKIGIYHTHSSESYVPTDGTESIPFRGGIFKVGRVLAERLESKGVKVLHSMNPHEPRDKNAYYRSRRTAAELIRQNPVALFDVHRDGIPDPDYYREKVAGQNIAQLRLVVGRQNPNMNANLDFARKLMATANGIHPGLVKEIFIARGNYNQDLGPTTLLIEAGTYTNSRDEAERGVALLADAVPTVVGVGPGSQGPTDVTRRETATPGGWKALGWLLVAALLGGGAFLVISSGGLNQAWERLRNVMGGEFAGVLASRRDPTRVEEKTRKRETADPGREQGEKRGE